MTNYTKKAVRGATAIFMMGILSSFLAYLIRITVARNLSPAGYGLFYAVLTLILFCLIFKDVGLTKALIKFIAEYAHQKNYSKIKTLILSSFLFQLLFSSLLFFIFYFLSDFLAVNYFKSDTASIVLKILALYLFSSLVFTNVRAILRGFQELNWFALTNPVRDFLTLSLILLFFYLGLDIFSPVFGYIAGLIIGFLIFLIPLSKYAFILKYKIKDFWNTTKQLFMFGVPVIFTEMGDKVIAYIDILILTYFVSLTSVGIYNVILPTAIMFLFIGRSVAAVLLPMISELWSKKDKIRISEGLRLIYKYSFILTIPPLFAVFVFSDVFIRLFFGGEYVAGLLAFKILLVGALCYIIAQINNASLAGIGRPKETTKVIFTVAAVNLGLNLLLIPYFQLEGAATATAVSYIVALIISTSKLHKFVKTKPPWKNWLKIAFAGIVFVLVIYFIKALLVMNMWLELVISLSSAGIIYLLLLFILNLVDTKELKMLIKRIIH